MQSLAGGGEAVEDNVMGSNNTADRSGMAEIPHEFHRVLKT